MSYTRWSTDDFRSDVYCYPHVDGHYQLEIASSKEMESSEETNSHVTYRMPIDLPYDGHSFSFDTLEELFNKLSELRSLGYYIADSAFNNIEKEIIKCNLN